MLVLLLLVPCPVETYSWEKDEHKILADLVFDSTLSYCEIEFTDSLIFIPGKPANIEISKMLFDGHTFGNIAVLFSGDDLAQSRCHMKRHTIMQQLESLSASYIDEV